MTLYLSVMYAALACGWVYVAADSVTEFLGYTVLGLAGIVTGVCVLFFSWEGLRCMYVKSRSKWFVGRGQ
jgi:hypothetical protein